MVRPVERTTLRFTFEQLRVAQLWLVNDMALGARIDVHAGDAIWTESPVQTERGAAVEDQFRADSRSTA